MPRAALWWAVRWTCWDWNYWCPAAVWDRLEVCSLVVSPSHLKGDEQGGYWCCLPRLMAQVFSDTQWMLNSWQGGSWRHPLCHDVLGTRASQTQCRAWHLFWRAADKESSMEKRSNKQAEQAVLKSFSASNVTLLRYMRLWGTVLSWRASTRYPTL